MAQQGCSAWFVAAFTIDCWVAVDQSAWLSQTQGLPAVQVENGVRPPAISRNPNQKFWIKPVVSSPGCLGVGVLLLALHLAQFLRPHPDKVGSLTTSMSVRPLPGQRRCQTPPDWRRCVCLVFSARKQLQLDSAHRRQSSALVSSAREPSVQSHKVGSKQQQTCLQGRLIYNSVSGSSLSVRRSLQSWRYVSAAWLILVCQFNDCGVFTMERQFHWDAAGPSTSPCVTSTRTDNRIVIVFCCLFWRGNFFPLLLVFPEVLGQVHPHHPSRPWPPSGGRGDGHGGLRWPRRFALDGALAFLFTSLRYVVQVRCTGLLPLSSPLVHVLWCYGASSHNRGGVVELRLLARTQGRTVRRTQTRGAGCSFLLPCVV